MIAPSPGLPSSQKPWWTRWQPGVVLPFLAIGIVYALRLDDAAGLMVDDAWYIVLAKAIAQGDGYRLISSATAEILPAVPPGFPALLSPIVLAVPRFPDHVLWMKLMSIAAVFAAGAICWRDFTRHRALTPPQATLIVAATLLTPAIVFLATSTVMAECAFLLAQTAAMVSIERITRRDADDPRAPIIAALLTAAALLIRSAGAALVLAAIAFLVISRRWRQTAVFAGVLVLCVLPWTIYAAAHAATDAERAAHGGTIAYSYSRLLTAPQLVDPSEGTSSAASMLERATSNLTVVLTRDVGAVLLPAMYRGPDESGQEVFSIGRPMMGDMGVAGGTMIVSTIVGAIILFGWMGTARERLALPGLVVAATLPMIAPVGGQTFRYLIPLTPYLVLLFWHGLRSPAVARMALLIIIGLHGLDHAGYIHQKLTATPDWIADWRENREVTTWIARNVPGDATLAATNPGLIYLGSNRRTRAIDAMRRNWEEWKRDGVRYVVSTVPNSDLPSKSLGWQLRFRSDRHQLWVVEIED
jgi:hypothetical protein